MSSYYNFQNQQANEQLQARYQAAEAHRMAKEANGPSSLTASMRVLVPALIGLVVVFFILTGCSPDYEPTADVEAPTYDSNTINMGERIQFQDRLEAPSFVDNVPAVDVSSTMADRIEFQDSRDASLAGQPNLVVESDSNGMADRIEFQDSRDASLNGQTNVQEVDVMTMHERIQFQDSVFNKNR